jgi:hypothetical protein
MSLSEFGRTVHPEMAALIDAARRGVAVNGLTMDICPKEDNKSRSPIVPVGTFVAFYEVTLCERNGRFKMPGRPVA